MIIQEQGFPHENRRPEDNCCGGGIRSEESNDGGDLKLGNDAHFLLPISPSFLPFARTTLVFVCRNIRYD
jgi:hypothetical protein